MEEEDERDRERDRRKVGEKEVRHRVKACRELLAQIEMMEERRAREEKEEKGKTTTGFDKFLEIGAGMRVRAHVPQCKHLMVNLGVTRESEFWVQLELHEARAHVTKVLEFLEAKLHRIEEAKRALPEAVQALLDKLQA